MKFKISAETPCIKGMQHLFYFNNCQRRDYSELEGDCQASIITQGKIENIELRYIAP